MRHTSHRQAGGYRMPACAGMTTSRVVFIVIPDPLPAVIPAEQAQRARAGIQ